ncbi:MAG: sigma-70 family RNA polymerase sigma factor [Candidatus Pacebacteria bacterium]|nr:sigma-70 family RNA polymerase sigma factor [Candidatus Paceibacterota bacterium]
MSKTKDNLSDADVIDRFKKGDKEVFSILVERYSTRAYQIAYGVLHSREDAEEVAQDVFVRIYKALPKFRGDAEFSTWMYRIAMNLARNKYRWNKSRGAKQNISIQATRENNDDSGPGIQVSTPELSPDSQAELSEFTNTVMREIQNLPPLYREALVLRNVEEMSYERIAEVLDCKLGTIKSRIARARDELRKRLES